MPGIMIEPTFRDGGKLSANQIGMEFLEIEAVLHKKMSINFLNGDQKFPDNGFVRIRRGLENNNDNVCGEFSYMESYYDDETGITIPNHFEVFLDFEEKAFDRLIQRLWIGLPDLFLFFEDSKVITYTLGGDSNDLHFDLAQRPWEKINRVTLTQHLSGRLSRFK